MHGFCLLDKPTGISSMQALTKLKRALYEKYGKVKLGHTGTLDPFASGILPVCIGKMTKLTACFLAAPKSYLFEITFRTKTDTGDPTGQIIEQNEIIPSKQALQEACEQMLGEQMQTPHAFSAVKINGTRAYKLARQGNSCELEAKPITIHSLQLIDFNHNKATLEVDCSKGTYVRSLAIDLAAKLGTIAHVSKLHRIKYANITAEQLCSIEQPIIQPPIKILEYINKFFPTIQIPSISKIIHGEITPIEAKNQHALVYDTNKLGGLVKIQDGMMQPVKVLDVDLYND